MRSLEQTRAPLHTSPVRTLALETLLQRRLLKVPYENNTKLITLFKIKRQDLYITYITYGNQVKKAFLYSNKMFE